jgi:hypothetical protein
VALAEGEEGGVAVGEGEGVAASVRMSVCVLLGDTVGVEGVQLAAPAELRKPLGHVAHAAAEGAPVAWEKVPAGQGVAFTEARGQKEPAGHKRHAALALLPLVGL